MKLKDRDESIEKILKNVQNKTLVIQGGTILNILSVLSWVSSVNSGEYSAAK